MTPAALQRRPDSLGVVSRKRPSRTRPPVIGEALFRDVVVRERKRADRSNQPLALILVELKSPLEAASADAWRSIIEALSAARRETDALGWFENHKAIGLLLPEVPAPAFSRELSGRICREISRRLDAQSANCVSIRLHVHPGPAASEANDFHAIDAIVTPGEKRQARYERGKRVLDVALSAALLAILSPVFLVLAALVKLTSPGPVFFKQERVGQIMKPFTMLKFRTMHVNSDDTIHRQFISPFIRSRQQRREAPGIGLFKIANDSRVTPIGRILRKTSLDELPQLWNALRGDMSLVGPRPPLAYELEQYHPWHRRRVFEAKPGITGLWQVQGRSRTTFDEMVRLDLRYAKTRSLATDIRILLATPRAVASCQGTC